MPEPRAPLPPRQPGLEPPPQGVRGTQPRKRPLTTLVFFIVGLSVILSFDWSTGSFSPNAPFTIAIAVLIAVALYVLISYVARNIRRCVACGRSVPMDAVVCPYCGGPLS